MRMKIILLTSVLFSQSIHSFVPARCCTFRKLSNTASSSRKLHVAQAEEDTEEEAVTVWTDDDFWAAEEARQKRMNGKITGIGSEMDDADDDSFDFSPSDIQAAEDAKMRREEEEEEARNAKQKNGSAWENMHPLARLKLIEKGQQRAIMNKKKREPASVKKRRLMMMYKQVQVKRKRESRVQRPLPLYDMVEKKTEDPVSGTATKKEKVISSLRKPLSAFEKGQEVNATVISLKPFGAYIDIGSSRDALLHVSDMSDETFVEHPRDIVSPGDQIDVKIKYVDAENDKLAVTMVALPEESEDDEDEEDIIQLDEVDIDDELWGEIKKVTDYGAYVNLGAVVEGFLHFMDHPDYGLHQGESPSAYLKAGQRIRVWVSNVDEELDRIKLTGNRPSSLPSISRTMRR